MLWDLFCRVIDNHGDAGVAWRLAADLAARGERVRLWIDDARALAWMAPEGADGVDIQPWPSSGTPASPGDVVIETFGCELPSAWPAAMARRSPAPVWLNLEYLSAESYVERSHGLRSPQCVGPGAGLDKWFFYPGFTPATGGLLREPALAERQAQLDRYEWLAQQGWAPMSGERVVVLFCYDNPAVSRLVSDLSRRPTLLLACPGPAQRQLSSIELPHTVRQIDLPWLTQTDFDHLLWSADLNCVRGEDSFVRAQWAGRPFLWQIYPQHDLAHAAKLGAFLDRFDGHPAATDSRERRALLHAWNGLTPWPERWPDPIEWSAAAERWRCSLWLQPDLVTQLRAFVAERR